MRRLASAKMDTTKLPWKQVLSLSFTNFSQAMMYTTPFTIGVFMVRDFQIAKHGGDETQVDEQAVSRFTGLLASAFSFAGFLTAYAWGCASNHIGRKSVIIIGNAVSYISILWFGASADYGAALAARAVGGFFNGIIGAWKCMIGESTPPLLQGTFFGYLSLAWGLGCTAGPTLGSVASWPCERAPHLPGCGQGQLLRERPYFLPCLIVSVTILIALLLSLFLLEETLPQDLRERSLPAKLAQWWERQKQTRKLSQDGYGNGSDGGSGGGSKGVYGDGGKEAHGKGDASHDLELACPKVEAVAGFEEEVAKGDGEEQGGRSRDYYGHHGPSERASLLGCTAASISTTPPSPPPPTGAVLEAAATAHAATRGESSDCDMERHPLLREVPSDSSSAPEVAAGGAAAATAAAAKRQDCITGMGSGSAAAATANTNPHRAYIILVESPVASAPASPPASPPNARCSIGPQPCTSSRLTMEPSAARHSGDAYPADPNATISQQHGNHGDHIGERSTSEDDPAQQQPQQKEDEERPAPQLRPWYRTPQVLLATLAYGAVAFIFCALDEVFPIYAAAPRASGGLGMRQDQLAAPLMCFGALLMSYSLLGYPRLQRRLGTLRLTRLGLLGAVVTCGALPLVATVRHSSTAAAMVTLYGGMLVKALAQCSAFTGAIIAVNAAPSKEQLGAVNGAGQTLAALVRGVGPALGGVLWAASLELHSAGQQFLTFGLIAVVAMGNWVMYGFLRLPGLK